MYKTGTTFGGKGRNPALRKGHSHHVAHTGTAEEAESNPGTELYSVASLKVPSILTLP